MIKVLQLLQFYNKLYSDPVYLTAESLEKSEKSSGDLSSPNSGLDRALTSLQVKSKPPLAHSMILASPTIVSLIFLAVSRHVHIEPKIQILVTKLLMITINISQNALKHMLINPAYYQIIAVS